MIITDSNGTGAVFLFFIVSKTKLVISVNIKKESITNKADWFAKLPSLGLTATCTKYSVVFSVGQCDLGYNNYYLNLNKMNKLLPLISVFILTIFLQSCDERINPAGNQFAGTSTPTVSKTELISRRWVYQEINFDVDGKKIVVYGNNKTPNSKVTFLTAPNDYFLFSNNGDLETYTDSKKRIEKGTWKFVSNENQLELTNTPSVVLFDIDNLSATEMEVSFTVLMANLAKESADKQAIIAVASFGGIILETSKKVKYTVKLVAN